MADPGGGSRRLQRPLALVRPPAPALVHHATLTFLPRAEPDLPALQAQHRSYARALARGGFRVRSLPPLDSFPDATFVEDLGIGVGQGLVLGRSAVPARAGEVEATVQALRAGNRSPHGRAPTTGPWPVPVLGGIQAPGTLDGGDVVVMGRRILVGRSTRTNDEGRAQLAGILAPLGYEVVPVTVRGALHLKTALTALDANTAVLNPEWVSPEELGALRLLPVAAGEPFAANVLPLPGGIVLMSSSAPETAAFLRRHGYRVALLDISEFEKAEGGLTCLSLRMPLPGN